jgi:HEPN domain-containing protein
MTREISKKWLEEAINDYEMGNILLNSNKFNGAVFHYQQAVEKSLKACLYYSDQQPWGHSILKLIQDLVDAGDESFKRFTNYAREIDRHYTTTRYPDALPNLSPKEAYDKEVSMEIKMKVEEMLSFIKTKLKELDVDE